MKKSKYSKNKYCFYKLPKLLKSLPEIVLKAKSNILYIRANSLNSNHAYYFLLILKISAGIIKKRLSKYINHFYLF